MRSLATGVPVVRPQKTLICSPGLKPRALTETTSPGLPTILLILAVPIAPPLISSASAVRPPPRCCATSVPGLPPRDSGMVKFT